MRPLSFLPLALPLLVSACNHEHIARQSENSTLPFDYTPGTDGPADPATLGYFINHVALLSSNITATRDWYSEVLGLRHIFTVNIAETMKIMYMGHSQGGRNGTGFQTGDELATEKNNLAGLVEFVEYVPDASAKKFDPTRRNTLSHLGLIVPDLNAAQARFDQLGVTIIKRTGALDLTADKEENKILAAAYGISDLADEQANAQKVAPGLIAMGFKEFIVVADPDGNLFEVQALNPTSI